LLNDNLALQKQEIELIYQQLKDASEQLQQSIGYAYQIQSVVMPKEKELETFFSDVFILYKPKDIVSGDFYWFSFYQQHAIFVLADCTGHGVPGAFMSMLGATLLHEIVNVRLINDPACILQNIDTALQEILKQKEGRNSDGMDIAICYFEKIEQKNTKIIFAGSKSKLFCVDNKQLIEIVGDRHFLGGRKEGTKIFTNKELILSSDAQFYFFSDGFSDQNNQKRQKIGSKYFKELVLI